MPSALPLTLDDLQAKAPKAPQVVQKIRDSHHQLARLVAQGVKIVEIGEITGYSPGHIRQLEADPAFQELVVHYQGVVKEKFSYTAERLAGLASDTVQELHDRLRESPDEFTVTSLTELAKITLDRSGLGPTKTVNQTTITAQVTSDDLARIRAQKTQGGVRQIGEKKSDPKDHLPASAGVKNLPIIDGEAREHSQSEIEGLPLAGHLVREEVRTEGPAGLGPDPRIP